MVWIQRSVQHTDSNSVSALYEANSVSVLNEASSSGHVSKSAQRLKPNANSGNTRVLIQPIWIQAKLQEGDDESDESRGAQLFTELMVHFDAPPS